MSGTEAEQYSVQEPTVLYEGSSILFKDKSNVFKMWHTCGWSIGNVCYAESLDGINFVRYGDGRPIIAGVGRPFVFHLGNTYYLYASEEVFGSSWSRYESTDGVQWNLVAQNLLTIGDKSWNKRATGNIFVWIENSTWYAMYEALGSDWRWRLGLATSTDGITWSPYAKNPVISFPYCGGPEIHKVEGTYYMWGQCNQTGSTSSDIYRLRSSDLVTWIPELIAFPRQNADEGPMDNDEGQVADPSFVEVNGSVYMYYDATPTQHPSETEAIHLNLAITNMSIASLATSN